MQLVSGECRLAIVLYRAYLARLNRWAGGVDKSQYASDQVHLSIRIECERLDRMRAMSSVRLSPFARAGSRNIQD